MYLIHLKRISSANNNLRSNDIWGQCRELPAIGQRFQMTADPLEYSIEYGYQRYISTSPIVSLEVVKKDYHDIVNFLTFNSTYSLTIIQEVADENPPHVEA